MKVTRITENDLKRMVKESLERILSEADGLTYGQIKNVTGIEDSPELNAAVATEKHEELESQIWRSLVELADGNNPRRYGFLFKELCAMLQSKFGLKYVGADENNECHDCSDGDVTLSLCPRTFYQSQGTMNVENLHVM